MIEPEASADETTSESQQRTVVVGVDSPEIARQLLPIAIRAARARLARLRVIEIYEEGSEPPALDLPDDHHLDVQVIPRSGSPAIAFRAAVREFEADLLILPWREPPENEAGTAEDRAAARALARQLQELFLDPPCEAWLVHGGLGGRDIGSLLVVPSNREPSLRALSAAHALLGAKGEVTVLDVHGSGMPEPSSSLRSRIDEVEASGAVPSGRSEFRIRSVVARSRERATIEETGVYAYDLLVMDVPVRGVPGFGAPMLPDDLVSRLDGRPLVVVNRPQSAMASRIRSAWNVVYHWVGALDPAQRTEVYSDLRRSARADRDFLILTVLATAIASLGLLLDSVAVIIGAMLVAPFMSPLLALGLAVVHGDPRFIRVATGAIVRGTVVGFIVGVLIGLVLPPASLPDELVARTAPSGLDLMVALFSGAAGAYALGRRDLSAALPGVAIAAALVPPLASSAIALSASEWDDALGAGLLYVMNVGAIAGAAAVVFLFFGFRPEVQRFGRVRSFVSGFALISVLLLAVFAAVLFLGAQDRQSSELTVSVEAVIEEWLPPAVTLEAFTVTRSAEFVEVNLAVRSRLDLGDAEAATLAGALADALGEPARVELETTPLFRAAAEPTNDESAGDGP